jgi:hypothetical protein
MDAHERYASIFERHGIHFELKKAGFLEVFAGGIRVGDLATHLCCAIPCALPFFQLA